MGSGGKPFFLCAAVDNVRQTTGLGTAAVISKTRLNTKWRGFAPAYIRREMVCFKIIQRCFVDQEMPRRAQAEHRAPDSMSISVRVCFCKPSGQDTKIIRSIDAMD